MSGSLQFAEAQPSALSLHRIFNTADFTSERFGPAHWIEDGRAYTTLESSREFPQALDIIRYETKNGHRSVLVGAESLIPAGKQLPLIIEDYQWSHQGKYLMIYTNSRKVWRRNTRGDYWLLDLTDRRLRQLGKSLPSSSLMFAKFSPDDRRVGFVSGNNLYIEDLESHTVTALTTDGSKTLINGTFDWAYEEEFGARDGFRWSPDGEHIAYWQVDASGIRDFLMINNTDSLYPYTIPIQYPKVGEDPSSCRIGVIPSGGGTTVWVPVPGDAKQNYLPRMAWAPDSRRVLIQQIPRKQNTNHLWVYHVSSGSIEKVHSEVDEAWVRAVDDWTWINKGLEFTWPSEKTGWNHLYRLHLAGSVMKPITSGSFDVVDISLIDERNGYVYFIASPYNPTQRYLYRTKISGKGRMERLTPSDQPGDHSYQVAPNGKYAIHTYSTANTPPLIDLVALPSHKPLRTLAANRKFRENLMGLHRGTFEFFQITTTDGIPMDGYMIRPPDFDPTKKYPVVFYVYGEPARQTARDQWGGTRALWHILLAQQGYIVVTLDNRGTPSPKGRQWRKSLYRNIGILNIRDLALGAREVLKQDFLDMERVGVWGWSGGGSSTLNLLFQYPDIFKTGISVAPVANQLLYDNIYQERYMGVPWETKEDFIRGSPITHARNLKGNLLLIHGSGDDNVHYQNSEALVNELIRHQKIFQFMSYPNRSHSISEGENTSLHLYSTMTHFLSTQLEPGGKPSSTLIKD